MSHLRDLLHGVSRPSSAKVAARTPATVVQSAPANSAVAVEPHPDFPVEVAHFGPDERLIFQTDPRSAAADRYRLLRMRLKEHWNAGKLKKLLITGPATGDGKSTVALNLATALSERGERTVLVVEADLHRSSLTGMLRLGPWPGLTQCLASDAISPLSAIRRIEPFGWHLLPAGEPLHNPTELLQTPALFKIMQELSACFDWILIDSPPVLPLTDSISLRQHADGALLVVRAEQTPREALEQTVELLGKQNVVGIILNAVEARADHYYQYYAGAGGKTGE